MKNFEEFIKSSKRLRQASNNQIHVRYTREGNFRKFYYINDEKKTIRFVGKKKREDAYDKNWINKLYKKLALEEKINGKENKSESN